MASRPLPKDLQRLITSKRHAHKIDEGWTERDEADFEHPWSHWIWFKPGWRNYRIDPVAPLHAIHEWDRKEIRAQLNEARPCDCEECIRSLTTE